MSDDAYDAIVIGTGAGGAIVAALLAGAGHRVLVLERGRRTTTADDPRDHLRNHRLARYGHNTGPDLDGNPRVLVAPDGRERTLRPNMGGWSNNAMALGGGTVVYGGQAWRFMPQDFRMASTYGVPEGSSLADWPISYDELAPDYERVEWEIGVSGDAARDGGGARRPRALPMPPMPPTGVGRRLEEAAAKLGWPTAPPPLLVNSVPYNGRGACVGCGQCVGFVCPTDAKNGGFNTLLPRAVSTGLCEVKTGARATRVDTDGRGEVIGVTYVDASGGERWPRARAVIVSCGAIESARLLLLSSSKHHPAGLGNASDQVGRHLQGHHYPGATGWSDEPVCGSEGPGPSVSTCEFNHGNAGVVGGGMLADDFVKLPVIFWHQRGRHLAPRQWGGENKRFMREMYAREIEVKGPIQQIPTPDCRVRLDPTVRDSLGLPVARLSGSTHPATLEAARFLEERAVEWVTATGAARVAGSGAGDHANLRAGQHQAGTCRMGTDPKASVCDPFGRVHGHDHLYVIDASLHVTNGGFNPALTIMALAMRCGARAARDLKR